MVKTVSTSRTINTILLNIKIQTKLVRLCDYKLATSWQNFTEIYYSLSENIAKIDTISFHRPKANSAFHPSGVGK